jgi:hypothetical protein
MLLGAASRPCRSQSRLGELARIDREGGHRASLWFSRPAGSVEELGVLLSRELHAGIC